MAYCYTCSRSFCNLGIKNHRKAHRSRREDCKVYEAGKVKVYRHKEPDHD